MEEGPPLHTATQSQAGLTATLPAGLRGAGTSSAASHNNPPWSSSTRTPEEVATDTHGACRDGPIASGASGSVTTQSGLGLGSGG
jgi:hypothetical protein